MLNWTVYSSKGRDSSAVSEIAVSVEKLRVARIYRTLANYANLRERKRGLKVRRELGN